MYEPIESSKVLRSFVLLTDGKDKELDSISIAVECFRELQGHEIGRVLQYLTDRYTLKRSE